MGEPALEIEALTVLRGGRYVVEDASFIVNRGEVFAILGPNGAGKSTVLRAVAGLLPHAGTIRIDGRDAARLDAVERARALAYVPQVSRLDSPLTVREVVAQGRYAYRPSLFGLRRSDREAVDRALERTETGRFATRAFTALSEGERRRVLLARALATGARLLLLDEPTAALDVAHVLDLHALLRALGAEGYAVLVVLHPLDDARRWCDRALLLDEGRAVACGPARDVVCGERVRPVYGVELEEDAALGFRRVEGRR